jgi:hypothetical protein
VRSLAALIGVLVWTCAVALIAPAPSHAAPPARAALYADTDYAYWVYLRVSPSGRSLDPRASRIEDLACNLPTVRLGTRDRRVRVSRSGRFRFVRRRGAFVLRIRGRFTSRDRARVSFRLRREPERARPRDCEDSGRVRLAPARVGQIPFQSCREHRATNVLVASTGRVFWEDEWDDSDGWTTVAHACLFAVDKRFELSQDEDDDYDVYAFRLAGPYVAYARVECGSCPAGVNLRDLRDGARLRGGLDDAFGLPGEYFDAIDDLELKENGSLAVIADLRVSDDRRDVWAYDAGGKRLLDSGSISPRSLRLTASTLSWKKDGAVYTAELD